MKSLHKSLHKTLLVLSFAAALSACGTANQPAFNQASLPGMSPTRAQRAQSAPAGAVVNTVFAIDKTELREDVNGQQYGFDHLTITHRNAYGYHQDSIHMSFRRDRAMFLMTETRGLHLPAPEQEHRDLRDHDEVLRAIDRLQVLKPRTAQHKAHIALAIKVLRRNLDGMQP